MDNALNFFIENYVEITLLIGYIVFSSFLSILKGILRRKAKKEREKMNTLIKSTIGQVKLNTTHIDQILNPNKIALEIDELIKKRGNASEPE